MTNIFRNPAMLWRLLLAAALLAVFFLTEGAPCRLRL
jgi:hypothetical protein